jgi:hypothetical protein
MIRLLIAVFAFALLACSGPKSVNYNKDLGKGGAPKKEKMDTISAPVVKKAFINKGGKASGGSDYYVQRSIQDYFIKFCESKVSRAVIDRELAKQKGMIKTLKMIVSIREGEWDRCPGQGEVQSRIGDYMVIHEILE